MIVYALQVTYCGAILNGEVCGVPPEYCAWMGVKGVVPTECKVWINNDHLNIWIWPQFMFFAVVGGRHSSRPGSKARVNFHKQILSRFSLNRSNIFFFNSFRIRYIRMLQRTQNSYPLQGLIRT